VSRSHVQTILGHLRGRALHDTSLSGAALA
jgi:hypothetical protein